VLVALVAWPLAAALFLALVLAGVLAPLQNRLTAWLRGRRGLAAGILVLALLFLVIGPLVGLSAVLVREAAEGLRFVLETVRSEGMSGLIQRLPPPLDYLVGAGLARLGDLNAFIEKHLAAQGGRAAAAAAAALFAAGTMLFHLVMMLIALFFLLIQGRALLAWVDEVSPLREGQTRELLLEVRKVSSAVIVSTLVTAAVQALAALVGYLIARVPHPIFFAFVTFIVATIPAIGAGAVVLFAALILLVTGHPYMSLFLALWGLLVVSLIDNVVKPYLIKNEVEMAGAVVFFSLIGGLAAFGMVGLLIGPLAVALLLALLRIYQREFKPAAR
jgi:predicted PurR-regulated permease PerM